MQQNLQLVVKQRILDEVNDTLGRHPLYRDDTKAYHKFHPLKERPQSGVKLMGSSATRMQLSPDDYMADISSHCSLAAVGTKEAHSIEWVWENAEIICQFSDRVDVTGGLDPSRRIVQVPNYPIVCGKANTDPATSFAEVAVWVNGTKTLAAGVASETGQIYLSNMVPSGATVEVSYWWKNLDIPGYYFIEIIDKEAFILTPLHVVKSEKVIQKTTGTETTAQLAVTSNVQQSVFLLWTKKQHNSVKMYLNINEDFTVDSNGLITFLSPLPRDTTLYASYRWQGPNRGPFNIPGEYSFNADAIKGVTIAFGSRIEVGDKQVILLFPEREQNAKVYGSHYEMSQDLIVFSRDPMSSAEIADFIVADLWGNKRSALCAEGLTLTAVDASGESEESYDDATGALYFEQSISIQIMTEWKKFVPYLVDLSRFDIHLHRYQELKVAVDDGHGNTEVVAVTPNGSNLEIIYPRPGYPRYF